MHYVGSVPNLLGSFPFLDPYSDDDIKTAPALEIDAVMPFPSFDVPMTGTYGVVGTQVTWVSGPQFNPNWAPGQEILINGVAYIVFGQPASATSLTTVENVGVLNGVPFLVAEPTLIGQPLPHIIGPFDQGNFLLGWGDPRNPGVIYATKGNDPDSAPIQYFLELSTPSEPIVGGVIYDNNAIVASNKRFWRISIDANAVASGQGNVLVKQELRLPARTVRSVGDLRGAVDLVSGRGWRSVRDERWAGGIDCRGRLAATFPARRRPGCCG